MKQNENAPRWRVLHIITTFSVSSGAAENTRLTINSLPRDRFEVFIAVPPGQSMIPQITSDVTQVTLRRLVRPIQPMHDLAALVEIYRLCKRGRFDIVHTHNSKDGILGRWAAHLAGVPVVLHTIHNLSFRASRHAFVNRLYAAAERLTAPITDTFLAVSSQNVVDYLDQRIGAPDQYRVVYSGLELERYRLTLNKADARAILGLPAGTPIVGWFGRLNYQKDPITFLRAAQEVAREFPDVRFVVCGDDPLGEDLGDQVRTLAQQLGISDQVNFLGFRSDLPMVLHAVDVVMHSSRYEGMGRTVCEALLCGRPVAGTAVDGMREVIISGVRGGIVVPPGQPAALAKATISLLRDPERGRQLAAAGGAWVRTNLSATAMVDGVVNAYMHALDRANRRGQRANSERVSTS
jgi:glycosyltransferase involved in cell wall biosynthesis